MTRNELIEKINAYVKYKGWNKTQFTVDGRAAEFILGDCFSFEPPVVQLSLSQSNCHRTCTESFLGLQFIASVNGAGWANISPISETDHFVVSTTHRLNARFGKGSHL